MIRAVLFDAVGTLIHLREPVADTYARFAREHGIELGASALQDGFAKAIRAVPPMAFAELDASAVVAAEREWWRTVVRSTFAAAGAEARDEQFDPCFYRLYCHYAGAAAWQPADGAVELLRQLRHRGLRTGMVSNFDHRLPAVLNALELTNLFDTVVLPAEVGAAKPDARIFARALEHLGVAANEAVYVGDDAEDDVAGAERAGLRAIDVRTVQDLRSLESLAA